MRRGRPAIRGAALAALLALGPLGPLVFARPQDSGPAKPSEPPPPTPVAPAAPAAPSVSAGAVPPAHTPPKPSPPVLPATLAIAAAEPEVALALAVASASRGDLAGATQRLAAASSAVDARSAELQTEAGRVQSLAELRRRLLERQRASGATLRLAGVNGKLVELSESELTLDVGSGKRRTAPMSEVTPEVVLRLHKAAGAAEPSEPGLAYAWLLAGEGPLRKNLADWARKAAGPQGAALLDERERYDALVARAGAAELLLELAGSAVPATKAEAQRQLESIGRLFREHPAEPLVSERADRLDRLARQALGVSFDADPVGHLGLRGRAEAPGPGRLRVTYDFESEDQLVDFAPVETSYMQSLRDLIGALRPPWEHPQARVSQGRALLLGPAALRSTWALCAPWRISYTLRWMEPGEGAETSQFLLGFCDDGHESLIMCHTTGVLQVMDKHTGHYSEAEGPAKGTYFIGTDYRMELVHDGKSVQLSVEGAPAATAVAGPVLSGALLLWAHTEFDVAVDDLVVEGLLKPAYVAARRTAWIDVGVAELHAPAPVPGESAAGAR